MIHLETNKQMKLKHSVCRLRVKRKHGKFENVDHYKAALAHFAPRGTGTRARNEKCMETDRVHPTPINSLTIKR